MFAIRFCGLISSGIFQLEEHGGKTSYQCLLLQLHTNCLPLLQSFLRLKKDYYSKTSLFIVLFESQRESYGNIRHPAVTFRPIKFDQSICQVKKLLFGSWRIFPVQFSSISSSFFPQHPIFTSVFSLFWKHTYAFCAFIYELHWKIKMENPVKVCMDVCVCEGERMFTYMQSRFLHYPCLGYWGIMYSLFLSRSICKGIGTMKQGVFFKHSLYLKH